MAKEDDLCTATITVGDVDGDDITVTLSDPDGDGDDDWLSIFSAVNNDDQTSTITLKGTSLNAHVGNRSFQLSITDSNIDDPIDATFTLTVENVNDATVATDDGMITAEDIAVSGNVLSNDVDVDTPTGMLVVILVADVSSGTLVPRFA